MCTSNRIRTLRRGASRAALGSLIGAVAILGVACADDDAPEESTDIAVGSATATATAEVTPTETTTSEATGTPPIATGEVGEGESVHVTYECADGLTFEAEVSQVPGTWAIIEVDGQTIEMEQTISGSGIRYQGDGYEYRSSGDEATLLQDEEEIRTDCLGSPSE